VVLVASPSGVVESLDPVSLKPRRTWKGNAKIRALKVSGDGATACVLADTGTAVILEAASLKPRERFETGLSWNDEWDIALLALSPTGESVVTSGPESTLVLRDTQTGKIRWRRNMDAVSAHFREDGRALLLSPGLKTFVLSVQDGATLFDHDQGGVVAWSPGGTHILVAPDGAPMKRINVATGGVRRFGEPERVWSLAADSSGLLLVSLPGNMGPHTGGRTHLRRLSTGEFLFELDHEDTIMSEIGWWHQRPLVGGSGGLYLFDERTGRQLAALVRGRQLVRQFTPTSGSLYALIDGMVFRWEMPPDLRRVGR